MLMATLIGFESRTALSEAVRESGVLLGGSIFLLTPTPIASVGLLLHALGGPTLRTIEALAACHIRVAKVRRGGGGGGGDGSGDGGGGGGHVQPG